MRSWVICVLASIIIWIVGTWNIIQIALYYGGPLIIKYSIIGGQSLVILIVTHLMIEALKQQN